LQLAGLASQQQPQDLASLEQEPDLASPEHEPDLALPEQEPDLASPEQEPDLASPEQEPDLALASLSAHSLLPQHFSPLAILAALASALPLQHSEDLDILLLSALPVLVGLIVQAPSVHAAKRAVTARNLFIEDSMCLCGQCTG